VSARVSLAEVGSLSEHGNRVAPQPYSLWHLQTKNLIE
jgi:hypothetical protein